MSGIRTKNGLYYLSGILDHKENYQLTPDINLVIAKNYENNLRERNPQIGIVEAVPEDNILNLKVGDTVVVHHLVFMGDIGHERAYQEQPHIELEGKKLFPCEQHKIFFKYEDKKPIPLGDYIICEKIEVEIEKFGLYLGTEVLEKECTVVFGNFGIEPGTRLLVEYKAMYEIEIDKVEYQRVFRKDIAAIITENNIEPYDRYFMGRDIEQVIEHNFLDLSAVKQNTVKTEILKVGSLCGSTAIGDIALRNPVGGIKREDFVFLNDDHVHFYLTDGNKLENSLRQ